MRIEFLAVERRVVCEVWRHRGLLAAHLAGNAALVGAAYAWLGIAEANWAAVLGSAGLALLVIVAGLWLHAAALAAFHGVGPGLALRRLPKVLPWAIVAAAVVMAGVWLAGYAPKVSAWLASWLTLRFRAAVSPRQVDWIYPGLLRAVCAVAVLALVPLASEAAGGFGLRAGLRVAARPRYWVACAVLVFAGLYVPGKLVGWVPAFESLAARAASVVVRFGLAYVLAVTAWLTLAALIAHFLLRREPSFEPAQHDLPSVPPH